MGMSNNARIKIIKCKVNNINIPEQTKISKGRKRKRRDCETEQNSQVVRMRNIRQSDVRVEVS